MELWSIRGVPLAEVEAGLAVRSLLTQTTLGFWVHEMVLGRSGGSIEIHRVLLGSHRDSWEAIGML